MRVMHLHLFLLSSLLPLIPAAPLISPFQYNTILSDDFTPDEDVVLEDGGEYFLTSNASITVTWSSSSTLVELQNNTKLTISDIVFSEGELFKVEQGSLDVSQCRFESVDQVLRIYGTSSSSFTDVEFRGDHNKNLFETNDNSHLSIERMDYEPDDVKDSIFLELEEESFALLLSSTFKKAKNVGTAKDNSTLHIFHSRIEECDDDHIVVVEDDSRVKIEYSHFVNNDGEDGCVYCKTSDNYNGEGPTAWISHSFFTQNHISQVYMKSPGVFYIENCTLQDNKADGLYIDSDNATMYLNDVRILNHTDDGMKIEYRDTSENNLESMPRFYASNVLLDGILEDNQGIDMRFGRFIGQNITFKNCEGT